MRTYSAIACPAGDLFPHPITQLYNFFFILSRYKFGESWSPSQLPCSSYLTELGVCDFRFHQTVFNLLSYYITFLFGCQEENCVRVGATLPKRHPTRLSEHSAHFCASHKNHYSTFLFGCQEAIFAREGLRVASIKIGGSDPPISKQWSSRLSLFHAN
jgi:hypothetical protein